MAIAEVTTQRFTGAGATATVRVTYPATPTQGNLLVAGFSWRGDATVSAVPSGWSLATNGGNGAGIDSAIYYKIAGASEPTVHDWTLSADVKNSRVASEWSGLKASPLDKTNSNTNTGTAGTTNATGVLAQANELVVALFSNINTNTWASHDNGLTEIGEAVSTGGGTSTRNNTSLATKVTSATTSVNYGATLSGSQVWSAAVATFMEAPASQNISAPDLLGGAQVFSPTIAPGQVAVTPSLLGGAQVFAPTVDEGAASQAVTPDLLGGAQVFSPTILPGSVLVTPALLGGAQVFAITVAPGSVSVAPALLGGAQVFAPVVVPPSQAVALSLLGGVQVFAPSVAIIQAIQGPALLGGAQVFSPVVLPGSVLVTPALLGGAQLFAPVLSITTPGEVVITIEGLSEVFLSFGIHVVAVTISNLHQVEVSIE